jgi:hypothetical protein
VQARRIALGDRTPVVLANLGSDRYHPGSLACERPVLVVRWGLLYVQWSLNCGLADEHSNVSIFGSRDPDGKDELLVRLSSSRLCQPLINISLFHWQCTRRPRSSFGSFGSITIWAHNSACTVQPV